MPAPYYRLVKGTPLTHAEIDENVKLNLPEHVVDLFYGQGKSPIPTWNAVFAYPAMPGFAINGVAAVCPPGNGGAYEFEIAGTGFSLWHPITGNRCFYKVFVDGALVATVDVAGVSGGVPAYEVYRLDNLTNGRHLIRLEADPASGGEMILNQIRVRGAFTSAYRN